MVGSADSMVEWTTMEYVHTILQLPKTTYVAMHTILLNSFIL